MEWIKATDRLPDIIPNCSKSKPVLVADFSLTDEEDYRVAYWSYKYRQWVFKGSAEMIGVTHWAEITPPVEGE